MTTTGLARCNVRAPFRSMHMLTRSHKPATTEIICQKMAENPPPTAPAFVRFWTKADKAEFSPEAVCPLMTQCGWAATETTAGLTGS